MYLRKIFLVCFAVFTFTCLMACNSSSEINDRQKEAPMTESDYTIKVRMGESTDLLINQNPKLFSQYQSGTSVGFIRPNVDMNEEKKIKIIFFDKNENQSLKLESIENLLFVSDSNYKKYGITDISLEIPVDDASEIKDKKVYLAFEKLIKNLNLSGWKVFYYHGDPRIFGEESFKLNLLNDRGSLDGYYLDNYEAWMKYSEILEINSLEFYNNGNYLTVSFRTGIDHYIIDMKFASTFSNYFYRYDEDIRDKEWATLLKNDLSKWQNERKLTEKKLKSEQYIINENYKDPEIWEYMKQ
jgi:hypothetical protein